MKDDYRKIATVAGSVEAEILKGLLTAREIDVLLRRESAGTVYGLGVGPLGEVHLLVPSYQEAEAHQVLDDYYAGKLEDKD